MKFKVFVFFILLALVLVFVYQNSTPVALQFVQWEYPVPLALLLLSVLAGGTLLGIMTVLRRQSYNKKKKAEKESAHQQQPEATAATSSAENDQGPEHQARTAETVEQTTTQLTGEDHGADNYDHRSDSRVW